MNPRKSETCRNSFQSIGGPRPTIHLIGPSMAILVSGMIPSILAADLPEGGAELAPAPAVQESHEVLFKALNDLRQTPAERGIEFQLSYTGEGISNLRGGIHGGTIYEGLVDAGVSVDLEKLAGWKGGSLNVSGIYAHGESPSFELLGDLMTLSNIDAYDSPRLYELWFQQNLMEDRFSVRLGQLGVDEEFATTDYGALFLHSNGGWPAMISLNAPSPAYPTPTPGVRLEFKPTESTFLRAAAFDGNPDPGDDNGRPVNPNGIRINFGEGAFLIGEAGVTWKLGGKPEGKPGNLKMGYWFHTEKFDDLRVDEGGISLADPLSSGTPRSHTGIWGTYASVEQCVYNEDGDGKQGLGVLMRGGFSPSNTALVSSYFETGFNYVGAIPGRDADVCGVSYSVGFISGSVRELVSESNLIGGANDPLPDQESALEITYQAQVIPGWVLQPSVWWIHHPGGSAAIKDSVLVGIRSVFEF